MHGVSYVPPSDTELTDLLTTIAANAAALRRMLPRLSLAQLDIVVACCPWEESASATLLELDSWARTAARTVSEPKAKGARTA